MPHPNVVHQIEARRVRQIMLRIPAILPFCMLVILLLEGCGGRYQGDRFVAQVGATNLLRFAAQAGGTNSLERLEDGALPKLLWPAFLHDSGILRIQPYFSGLQFILQDHDRFQTGVFVTSNLAEDPEDGSGISFVRLQPGLFWFEQKVRNVAFAEKLLEKKSTQVGTNDVLNDVKQLGESSTSGFVSGFDSDVRVPLSNEQVKIVSQLVQRLHKDGKRASMSPAMPYGSFLIGGEKYEWYQGLLYFVDIKRGEWIYVADRRIKDLSDRLEAMGKDPHDFTSNDWSTVLSVLETEGK